MFDRKEIGEGYGVAGNSEHVSGVTLEVSRDPCTCDRMGECERRCWEIFRGELSRFESSCLASRSRGGWIASVSAGTLAGR